MTRYKLIALDMDGTLLRSDKSLDPATVRDIEEAAGQGVQAVYSTGRAMIELLSYVRQMPSMRYAVCLSGALVYDFQEQRSIFCRELPGACIGEIVETAVRYDAMAHFLTERESIVRVDQISHMSDFHMGVYQPMFLELTRRVEDMAAEAARYDSIPKVNVYFRSVRDRAEAYEALKHLPLSFAFAEGASLEMNAAGVTKASGLQALTAHLGITMAETVGIGDADNDRAMLEAVGLSVAMGNAAEDIKALCDVVTEDNDHNGVGKAIRRYCLG
ncbi:MAG: Cof-type HAD-IIB family hydrolase [Lachnospiraceae bacterium]|nr:Cof-type HAD-IIB family hydrolase [Lachnospiraceae bacterium]